MINLNDIKQMISPSQFFLTVPVINFLNWTSSDQLEVKGVITTTAKCPLDYAVYMFHGQYFRRPFLIRIANDEERREVDFQYTIIGLPSCFKWTFGLVPYSDEEQTGVYTKQVPVRKYLGRRLLITVFNSLVKVNFPR